MSKDKLLLDYLVKLYDFMDYYNNMAPFPLYDTEFVNKLKKKIDIMKKIDIDYDSLPTVSCKYCDNLGIIQDEFDNDYCSKCGSVNEIVIHSSYHDYKKYIDDKNLNNDSN